MQYDNKEKVEQSGSQVSIINVMAGSLDGAIASNPDESDDERKAMGFINEADHDHVRELLASCDAVIAGGHSVNVSGGVMEVVNDAGRHPTWILCTRSGFEVDAPIWNAPDTAKWLVSDQALPDVKTNGSDRTLIYGSPEAPEKGLVQTICEACAEENFKRVLLFGGGFINAAFYEAGAVDEFVVTICPVIVGSEKRVPIVQPSLSGPTHFTLDSVKTEGNLVFIHYIAAR
jgi:riboflavin biosynthesis pyrimidine reductase